MPKTIRGGVAAALALLALALASAAQAETHTMYSEAGNSYCGQPKAIPPTLKEKLNTKPLTKKHKGPFPEGKEDCTEAAEHPVAMKPAGHPGMEGGPGNPAYPYAGSIPGASWVSLNANGEDGGNAPRYYIYNTTFNLECPNQAEGADLKIKLLADNTAGAFLNGVPAGHLTQPGGAPNFATAGGVELVPHNKGTAGGFKVGTNVVQFLVLDESGPYTGVDFSVEVTSPPCEIRWFSNGQVLEAGVREHVQTSASLTSTSTIGETTTTTKCKVTDEEIIENPVGGGNGVDEMTSFNLTGCKGKPSPCGVGEAFEIKALGLPWQTHLIAGSPIRDVIEGMQLEVLCGGKTLAVFSGSLTPAVGKSALEFGAGSGELEGPGGTKVAFTGKDKMKGPPGDEKITAG